MERRSQRERRPVKKWEPMDDTATPPRRPSGIKLVARDGKQVDLTSTDHHRAEPSLSSEEERETIERDDVRIVASSSPPSAAEEEAREGTNKRIKRAERIVLPGWLSLRERRRIEDTARRVVQEPDGWLTEKVLLRLFRITRNRARWGFLSPDHPVHRYYLQLKDMERCRKLRSELAAAAERNTDPSS